MIRPATMDDLPAMVRLVAEQWERGPFGDIPIEEAALAGNIGAHIVEPEHAAAWVSDVNGRVRGVLLAAIGEMPISTALAVSEVAFVCHSGEGRLLLDAMNKWADARGAVLTGVSVSSGHPTAGRVIESAGYVCTGGSYYRRGSVEQS